MQIKQKIDLKTTKGKLVWFGLFAFLFCFSFNPSFLSKTNRFVADSMSYLSHAMTIALDFDMDYSNEILQGLYQNRYIAPHPIGSGVMAAPFVALFSIFDRVSGHSVINDHKDYKYSWSIFGFILSAYFYFFLAVYLYWDSLRLVFTETSLFLVAFLSVSTGILFYVLNAAVLSHAFEFAGVAFLFWTSVKLFFSEKKAFWWLVLMSSAIMINLLIRYNNQNLVLLPLFVYIFLLLWTKKSLDRTCYLTAFRICLAACVGIGLFFLFNLYFFESICPSPSRVYGDGVKAISDHTMLSMIMRLIRLAPNTLKLTFGSEFGLLYSNPVLVFGFIFMAWFLLGCFKRNKFLSISAIIIFLLYYVFDICIVLWWQTTGSSYGYRYLFPLYPLALLAVLIWLYNLRIFFVSRKKLLLFKTVTLILYCLCVLSIFGQLLIQSTEPLSFKKQINMFGVTHVSSCNGYNKNLMVEMARPRTWIMAGGKRFPGFITGPLLMKTPLSRKLPPNILSEYQKHYADIPRTAYLQALLLFSFWMLFAFILYKFAQSKGICNLTTDKRHTG